MVQEDQVTSKLWNDVLGDQKFGIGSTLNKLMWPVDDDEHQVQVSNCA